MANNNKNRTKMKKTSRNDKIKRNNLNSKKTKVNNLPINGSIAMSKQLLMNKKNTKPKDPAKLSCNVSNRFCSNGKPMPSLKDLEKMFEDSDEEGDVLVVSNSTAPKRQSIITTSNLDSEVVKSPMGANICSTNILNGDRLLSPTKKSTGLDTFYTSCDLLSSSETSSNILESNKQTDKNNQINPKQIESCLIEVETSDYDLEKNNNTKVITTIEENIDHNSSDSNKTIDYSLESSTVFCPLPSTSKDNSTIVKNDELFFESLRKVSFSNKDNKDNIMDIKDDIDGDRKDGIDMDRKDNIYIDRKDHIDMDDDCIIIESDSESKKLTIFDIDSTEQKKNNSDLTKQKLNDIDLNISKGIEVIDIQLVTNAMAQDVDFSSNKPVEMDDDIIDIDALISDNQSMVAKYQHQTNNKSDNTLVVDVTMENELVTVPMEQNQPVMSTFIPGNEENLILNNDQQEVLFISETLPISNSSYNQDCQINTSKVCEIEDHEFSSLGTGETLSVPMQAITNNNRAQTLNQRESHRVHKGLIQDVQGFIDRCTEEMRIISDLPFDLMNPSSTMDSESRNNISTISLDSLCKKNKQRKRKPQRKKNPVSVATSDPATPNTSLGTSRSLGDCPICMDTFLGKSIASTICGHVFCMECLTKSIMTNNRCPTCRKILKKKGSFHQIFL